MWIPGRGISEEGCGSGFGFEREDLIKLLIACIHCLFVSAPGDPKPAHNMNASFTRVTTKPCLSTSEISKHSSSALSSRNETVLEDNHNKGNPSLTIYGS